MSDMNRKARIEDVHDLAVGMPYVTVEYGTGGNPAYQVGRKPFVFFHNPRPEPWTRDRRTVSGHYRALDTIRGRRTPGYLAHRRAGRRRSPT